MIFPTNISGRLTGFLRNFQHVQSRKLETKVDIISKQLIKPSSPTPDHLRHHRLSFLDQILIPSFVPLVFFYPKGSYNNTLEKSNILKRSLSQVLTTFYPLAGRISNNFYVDCNDEGFPLVEAKVNCELSDILRDKNPKDYNNLIPSFVTEEAGDLLAFSQITSFNCGGLAITLSLSHKTCDALSHFIFQRTWAAVARGDNDIKFPSLDLTTYFPPRNDLTSIGFDPRKAVLKDDTATKVLEFDDSSIEVLRKKYTVNGKRPSRVETLTGFIFSKFMATTQCKEEAKNKNYTVLSAVNLRQRIEPPLPMMAFGNIALVAGAKADMEAENDDTYGIMERIKESIRNANGRTLQNSDEYWNFLKKIALGTGEEEVTFNTSSLCHFPIYESDFGWSKPSWVAFTHLAVKNTLILCDAKEGKNVEAWICLKEEDMAKFEAAIEN